VSPRVMSCICWNCHELGKPTMMCVVETQIHKSRVEGLARRLRYDHGFAVREALACSGMIK
jgi:hypothetical protein